MKKVLALVTALVLVALLALPTCAASVTKQDIMDMLKSGVKVSDTTTVKIPDKYVQEAADYMNTHDLTEDMLAEVQTSIEQCKEIVKTEGVASLKQLSTEKKNEMVSIAKKAAEACNATLTVNQSTITVVDDKGVTYQAEVADVIKKTGSNELFALSVAVLSIVAFIGAAALISRKKQVVEAN